jgi:RNA polymerase sigma factor (sigma-70 family)
MTQEAIDARVTENTAFAHWCVRKWLGLGPEDAEYDDRVQEALLAIWRAAKGYDPGRRLKFVTYAGPGVYRAIRQGHAKAEQRGFTRVGSSTNRYATVGRSADLGVVEEAGGLAVFDDPTALDLEAVWAVVSRMTPSRQAVLRLYYGAGLGDAEIAARTGSNRPAVNELRRAAVAELREAFAEAT